MERISSNYSNDNMRWYARQREVDMSSAQSRMGAQTRILNLRDDPAAAAHATRYQSYTARLERYSDNIQMAVNTYQTTEDKLRQFVDALQEVRQLAVQGANGTYTPDELKAMGNQVDEYLQQLIQTANAVNGDGTAVFAGTRTKNQPFRIVEGALPGSDRTVITGVEYLGDIGAKPVEVADNQYVQTNFPGNQVFWADNNVMIARRDATDYVLTMDAAISIDGVPIELRQGDNIHAIVAKINDSKAAVKARIDPVQNSLVIETTNPHQLWLQDASGSVLQDLGVLRDGTSRPPQNLAKDVTTSGGSVFDALISLRNHFETGDQANIGGDVLRSLDSAMGSLLGNLGSLGAKTSRMELAFKTTEKLIPDYQARQSLELDLDITEAITEYKAMELTHQAALSTSARLMKTTLLDFLR